MLTLISHKHLKTIIALSGNAIRDFLQNAEPAKFKGESHMAITLYQANPSAYSDEKLVSYGANMEQAINYPVRIELRGMMKEGAAQMVAKGVWGKRRQQVAAQMSQQCKELGLHLKLAGTSSIEFNVEGVDKSLPIRFLQGAFDRVLEEMKYKPGTHIDSQKTRTVIAADGDGTVYDGPRIGVLPGLAESPVYEPLCAYLQAGGVFMLVSGNDLNRSFKRIVSGLPKEMYCRVLVAANGGAELVYVNAEGQPVPISIYRKQALQIIQENSHQDLDMVYIGDDGSPEGNDYPAFKAVGFKHSVLVAKQFLDEFDQALKPSYIGGLLKGTRKYLENYLSARLPPHTEEPHGGACCGDL